MNYFLGRNLLPKLLAVLVALIVWVFVMNEQNPPVDGTYQVALGSSNLTDKLVVIESPETVRVKVRGLRNAIAGASVRDFRATVDLKGLAPGQYNVPVSVAVPGGYELVEVTPDKVAVRIEALRSRQFTVEPRLTGPFTGQMMLSGVEVKPAVATVTGPQSMLDSVEMVLAPVEIKDQTPAFTIKTALVLLGPDGRELKSLKVEPPQVTVTGTLVQGTQQTSILEPGTATRVVDVKTVLTGNLPEGILLRKIFTDPLKVELKGPKEILDKLSAVTTEPVSLTGITKDVTKEVPLQLPPGASAVQKTVTVRINVGQGP